MKMLFIESVLKNIEKLESLIETKSSLAVNDKIISWTLMDMILGFKMIDHFYINLYQQYSKEIGMNVEEFVKCVASYATAKIDLSQEIIKEFFSRIEKFKLFIQKLKNA